MDGSVQRSGLEPLAGFLFQVYTASRKVGFEHDDAMEIVKTSFTWAMDRGQRQKKERESGDLDETIRRFFTQQSGPDEPTDDGPTT